jgi:protein involved in polysaccharide export with SLBB domain
MTRRISPRWIAAASIVAAAIVAAGTLQAQVPTSVAEAQRLLRANPELARKRLLESDMSQSDIRSRLVAAGQPAGALNAFLSGQTLNSSALDPSALAALESLGVVAQGADGLEVVGTVTGLQRGEADDATRSPVFGHDVFRRATSRFQPLLSGPVPDAYQLGPGDRLILLLTGEAELAHDLEVTREGFVVVPDVGRISVANLTMGEARVLFRERLRTFYSGITRGTTTVNLSITELRTIQVYLTGEVQQPGAYQLSSVATVTNALYAANGPTDLGSLRGVRIRRRDGTDTTLDLYPYLLEADGTGDMTLEQGDVVFVPLRERRVQLRGAVTRPKFYDLTASEDLYDALAAAGGFAPQADRKRLTVHRVVRPGVRGPGLGDRIAIDLALATSASEAEPQHMGGVIIPPVGLQDGDSIVIGRVPDLLDGFYVSIGGRVAEPTTVPWREGMTLRDLIQLARGPILGADLREAEVSRLPDQRRLGELADRFRVPLDSSYLTQRSSDGRYAGPPGVPFPPAGSSPEFVLRPYDRVQILGQPEFQMPQSAVITGEVSVPGRYTLLTRSDRISDLVARAGRILDTGYPEGARLFRTVAGLGRIDLNLADALGTPGGVEDLVLQPGDSLDIPPFLPTVVVRGAVISPVTVQYREGQDFDYYIEVAGGLRRDADPARASVRYANGQAETRSKFLFWSRYPTPKPGSLITVPAKDPADRIDKVALTTNLVGILGSLVTTLVVLTR